MLTRSVREARACSRPAALTGRVPTTGRGRRVLSSSRASPTASAMEAAGEGADVGRGKELFGAGGRVAQGAGDDEGGRHDDEAANGGAEDGPHEFVRDAGGGGHGHDDR